MAWGTTGRAYREEVSCKPSICASAFGQFEKSNTYGIIRTQFTDPGVEVLVVQRLWNSADVA